MRREVAKAVRLRKACTVVVAPNIEHIEAEGGLDDLLTSILTQAEASSIPVVFALSRKKLGQVCSLAGGWQQGALRSLAALGSCCSTPRFEARSLHWPGRQWVVMPFSCSACHSLLRWSPFCLAGAQDTALACGHTLSDS